MNFEPFTSIPDRAPRRLLEPLFILLLTVVGFAVMGYHPGLEDDGIYLSAVKSDLNPSLYPRDADFFRLQVQATLFDEFIAGFVRVTHIPLAWAELLWQFLSLLTILWAALRIAQRLFPERHAHWAGVALLAAMFTLPVSGTAINLVDQHLHPRAMATALILLAIERTLARRQWQAAVLLVLAVVMHPIMAAFGISFCWILALALTDPFYARWTAPSRTRALAAAIPMRWIFEPPSPDWRRALHTRSYYFLYQWTWYEWLGAIGPLVLFWLLWRWAKQAEEHPSGAVVPIEKKQPQSRIKFGPPRKQEKCPSFLRPSGTELKLRATPGFRCAPPWAIFLRSLRELKVQSADVLSLPRKFSRQILRLRPALRAFAQDDKQRNGGGHPELLARFAFALLLYGVFQQAVAMIMLAPPALVRLTPLQPMRYLQIVYVFLVLIGGCLLGRHVLGTKVWRWALFLVAANGAMFVSQRAMYPASQHLELPGRAPTNPWLQAFTWIRENTPTDAYFALDPNYLAAPGEDYHSFRALAERSQLADAIKDAAVATQVPELAPRWAKQVDAQAGWRRFQAVDFERLKERFGVDWVLVLYPAPARLSCVWHNDRLAVCRIAGPERGPSP